MTELTNWKLPEKEADAQCGKNFSINLKHQLLLVAEEFLFINGLFLVSR